MAHCDIKPDNIFLTESGRVRIGDFGLSEYADDNMMIPIKFTSPAYTSPEVATGIFTLTRYSRKNRWIMC